MLYTTIKLLRQESACEWGLETLIASLPEKHTETKLISLAHILKSNGLSHAIWALRATTIDARKIAARMAIDFAYTSLDNFEKEYPEDKRPRASLEQATLFLDGKITLKDVQFAARSVQFAAQSLQSAARSAELSVWFALRSAAFCTARSAESASWSSEAASWSAAESANKKIFKKWISKND